jgi:phosphoribosylpyrophosphate synthetase
MQIILNLADLSSSDIGYEKIKFADGQVSIKLDEAAVKRVPADSDLFILTQFNSYDDLFYLLAATDVLKFRGVEKIGVGFTCFLSQRSDERFKNNQSFDLQIITRIINSQNYVNVITNEPHSKVLPALLNNCAVMPQKLFFNFVKQTMINKFQANTFTIVTPDAGAYKRIAGLDEAKDLPLLAANKVRDEKGDPIVMLNGSPEGQVCVIIDDLCDGGRTFISLAKQLKEAGATKVVLAVVHGLFSYGLDVLKNGNIDHVICTNSISTIGVQHDGIKEHDYSDFVTQLDLIKRK